MHCKQKAIHFWEHGMDVVTGCRGRDCPTSFKKHKLQIKKPLLCLVEASFLKRDSSIKCFKNKCDSGLFESNIFAMVLIFLSICE
jgi:hypothetical protein